MTPSIYYPGSFGSWVKLYVLAVLLAVIGAGLWSAGHTTQMTKLCNCRVTGGKCACEKGGKKCSCGSKGRAGR